jgi:hypothetical protein
MSDRPSSQSQHDSSQSPHEPAGAGVDAWAELARRALDGWSTGLAGMAEIEGRLHEQGAHLVEEAARLQTASMKLALELARDGRRLAADAVRRAADLWTPA